MDETTKETTEQKSLLEEARANYKIADEWWGHNRKAWLEDAKFRALDQWPSDIRKKREAEGLPCLTFDKLNQYVKQVVNDGRQNRPAVKVRPIDDEADIEVADGLQGLIRSICNRSNADEAFDTALDHAAGNGFGFIRVITEYAHEKTFNQDLAVRRIRNPLTVLLGPHEMADGSDAEFGFVEVLIPKKKYKKQYPKAKETDWTSANFADGWSDADHVKVCEYFYKVEELANLHLLSDGTTATDEEIALALKETGKAPQVIETREIPQCKIKWCRLSGAEILEEKPWLGKYIPIIPVYGNESDIEGKVTYSGLIRAARDPQVLHNFSRSAFAQRVALTPKAPWLIAEGQIEGHETEWADPNGAVGALVYKSVDVDGRPVPPPQRISPTDVPAGFAQDMQMAEHDIQASMGMYSASLGEKSNEKSGKAIMARQREGDTATFHYQDNLNRAIRHLGRILVDMAPKIYDGTRVVRLLGEDGSTTDAQIDPRQDVAHQKQGGKSIYNLGIGQYDVDVAAGPSYTTKRQESAEAMIELTRANPTMWQTHGDLIVGAQDWPNAEAFAKRSKLLLPPEIKQAEEEDGDVSPEVQALRADMDRMRQDAEMAIQEREQLLQKMQQEMEALKASKDVEMRKLDIEAARLQMEASTPAPVEHDTSDVEFAKIEAEKWTAALEANKDVIVAAIQANSQAQSAAATASATAEQQALEPVVEAPEVDTNEAIVAALQGFTEAVQLLARPRTILRDEQGRAMGIQ
jgi:hypothetical protein